MSKNEYIGVVLAAGGGTRLREVTGDDFNKCAYRLLDKPLGAYPVEAMQKVGVSSIVVVVKHASQSVKEALAQYDLNYVTQAEEAGTAKALEAALTEIPSYLVGNVIVLYGDSSAFIDENVIEELISVHESKSADLTLLAATVSDPTNLGRILRDEQDRPVGIVEEKDATNEQKQINEINTGAAIYSVALLHALLPQIEMNTLKHEYYLTDIVKLAIEKGYKVAVYTSDDPDVGIGVNSRNDHEKATQAMKRKLMARSE